MSEQRIEVESTIAHLDEQQENEVIVALGDFDARAFRDIPADVFLSNILLRAKISSLSQVLQLRLVNKGFAEKIDRCLLSFGAERLKAIFRLSDIKTAKMIYHMGQRLEENFASTRQRFQSNTQEVGAYIINTRNGLACLEIPQCVINNLPMANMSGWYAAGCAFNGVKLTNTVFPLHAELIACTFNGGSLGATTISQSQFTGVQLMETMISSFKAQDTWWYQAYFSNVKAINIDLQGAGLREVNIMLGNFNGAKFNNTVWLDCTFKEAGFLGADFDQAILCNVTFEYCDLRGVSIEGWQLSYVRFVSCQMPDGSRSGGELLPEDSGVAAQAAQRLDNIRFNTMRCRPVHVETAPARPVPPAVEDLPPVVQQHAAPAAFFPAQRDKRAVEKRFSQWMESNSHPKIAKSRTSPALAKMCRVGYKLSNAKKAPYILYYIYKKLLPQLIDSDSDLERDEAILDIQQMLSKLNPMLLYFAIDIMEHFDYSQRGRLAIDMALQIEALQPLLLRSRISLSESLLAAKNHFGAGEFRALCGELQLIDLLWQAPEMRL